MGIRNLSVAVGLVAAVVVALCFAQIAQSLAHLGVAWWVALGGSVVVVAGILGLVWWSQGRASTRNTAVAGLGVARRRQAHRTVFFVRVPDDPTVRRAAADLVRHSIDQERRHRPLLWVAGASILLAIAVDVMAIVATHHAPDPILYVLPLLLLLWPLTRLRSRVLLTELDIGPNSAAAGS